MKVVKVSNIKAVLQNYLKSLIIEGMLYFPLLNIDSAFDKQRNALALAHACLVLFFLCIDFCLLFTKI